MSEKPETQSPSEETQRLPPLDVPAPESAAPAGAGALDLARAEKERDDFKARYMRALADFDNYQKRTKREMERFREDATRDLLKDLVLVLDNLDMTVAASRPQEGETSARPEATLGAVVKGVELVRDQLLRLVSQRGLQPLGTKPGDVFDTEKHEAVMAVPGPGLARDEVGMVAREGYRLGEKVLRPASVQVRKAQPS
jgi:molecular chaperone GrpE